MSLKSRNMISNTSMKKNCFINNLLLHNALFQVDIYAVHVFIMWSQFPLY